jgi:hypothetical protein
MRFRPTAVVLAMLLTGSAIGVVVQQSASATVSSGDRPVLISISPCRLADTRPNLQVGPQSGKIAAAETLTFDTQNATTQCAGQIPTDAVAISTNITALGATQLSFLTIWPSGPRPLAASLNPAPGEPPTPNAVVTSVDDGKFNIYNDAGETHVVIDINGYYVNHDHDDKYGDPGPSTEATVSVGAAAFDAWSTNISWQKDLTLGTTAGGAWITGMPYAPGPGIVSGLAAPLTLPHGATITSATAYFTDDTALASLNFQIRCEEFDGGTKIVAQGDSVAAPATGEDVMSITTTNATVDNESCSYFFIAESSSWASELDALKIRGVSITTQ